MTTLNQFMVINLEENSKVVYVEGVNILLRLLDNIIKEPQNDKFRCIRLENKIIKSKLLSVIGMKNLLLDIGFEEADDQLLLPASVLIARIKKYREYVQERLEVMKNCSGASSSKIIEPPQLKIVTKVQESSPMKIIVKPSEAQITAKVPFHQRITFPKVLNTSNPFLQSLETFSDSTMQYEDENLQKCGRALIPVNKLKDDAIEKLGKIQNLILSGKYHDEEPCYDDLFLAELASWFKNSFFTWVNSMPCKVCGNDSTQPMGTRLADGLRVEKYFCCNTVSEFFRYNDIETLLKTRSGRCGEWANCFTFFCRCMGYDARYIYSTGDHVWTEVFSSQKRRWIHVDPSENVIDSPLMYEHGWKKDITYVLAFSRDDVQDVTWRYSNDHKKVLNSRKSCTEREILDAIMSLRGKRQANCSLARKKFLKMRTLKELAELVKMREPTDDEKHGRSSGSLNWRMQRGEQQSNNFFVFLLKDEEVKAQQFNLRYSCSKDTYERFIKAPDGSVKLVDSQKKWDSCHFESANVMRKEELDWKMVYLARNEGSNEAEISWKFDFSKDNLKVKDVNLKLETKLYENSSIDILYLGDGDKPLNSLSDLKGLTSFKVKVKMSGGKGDIAWQHTQLFRQGKNSIEFPFELNIKF